MNIKLRKKKILKKYYLFKKDYNKMYNRMLQKCFSNPILIKFDENSTNEEIDKFFDELFDY